MARCPGTAWVVVRYADGTEVHAHPSHGPEDYAQAWSLGYPDVEAMTFDHDRLHEHLARVLGLPHSPVLWAVAHQLPPPAFAAYEESMVLAAQRFMNEAATWAN